MKEQEEDLENLQEDVLDLNPGREGSDLEKRRSVLDRTVKRAVGDLHSATGKLSMPSGAQGPPSIRVGGGGRGAPMSGPNTPPEPSRPSLESYSEKVGKIIDDSNEKIVEEIVEEIVTEEAVEDVTAEEHPRNPKKRMWEEEKEAAELSQRNKDEL
ncbi:hypothetical protein M7I_0589 [Glarea lozoyensis 74030]|uniref:Uncharacterized protein n=1 Tax=Glarea lozoyensis (strain ATCC 74030 / MF5533) TaxID=1104152 RepID=H0EDX9_GLAL7|nr:hypothetical protein M7I_0589 [Glarea lozoyensis 74030]